MLLYVLKILLPSRFINLILVELWIGTHNRGPSSIWNEGKLQLLSDHIATNPEEILGERVLNDWGYQDLPFLFKILSVNKSLSIQAHPDKQLAEHLHASFPEIYKDSNHKPELACALTDCTVLCQFRSFQNIYDNLQNYPELRNVVGEEAYTLFENAFLTGCEDEKKRVLRNLFHKLMLADQELVEMQVESLLKSIDKNTVLGEVIVKINQEFPGDVGIFCSLLLNVITLKPGDAVFLGPNEPHAYLSGDLVEAMACSDNVVRAGLTPKFKDVETLVGMLTYNTNPPNIIRGESDELGNVVYNTPNEEFNLMRIFVDDQNNRYNFPRLDTPSIILITQGNGVMKYSSNGLQYEVNAKLGDSYFVYADTDFYLESEEELNVFRITVP
eukprot:TRINITY_DN6533_c0_g1_i1.p1 TRINITY_DN6533_c0_g1~~TRINITY_DN6533_c0_g1_i1.p1  ORF type:complete len:386 (+),score=71.57 TRINITY_DN6533_c0_g1_i1:66-1223(+)